MSSSKPAIRPTPNASCRCSTATSPAPARRRDRPPPTAATPAGPISSPPSTGGSPTLPFTRSAASRLPIWSRALRSTAACAASAPASKPSSPGSSAPTAAAAAPGAVSNTSRPTSGLPWSPTTWCCWPDSNGLSRQLAPTGGPRQIRSTRTARNAIPQSASATPARKVGRTDRNPSNLALHLSLEKSPLWMRTSYSRLTHATATVEALKRGMRLIVVDPRHVGLASKADLWLRVRPGTDGALALGLANLMIERGWYDRDFIRDWSNAPLLVRADNGRLLTECDLSADGDARRLFAWNSAAGRLVPYDPASGRYDGNITSVALAGEYRVATAQGEVVCHPVFELYARLCRRYPPEAVEKICWIPRAQVERGADLIWHARPASYYAWSGHEQHATVTQTARAISLLYALTGSFDQPGGNVLLPAAPAAPITGEELPSAKSRGPTLGLTERPLGPARWKYYTTPRSLPRHSRGEAPPGARSGRLRREHAAGPC